MRTSIGGAHRIDAVGRALAARPGRRGLLRGVISALGLTLAGGPERALAACKRVNRNCDRNGDCCAGAECRGGKCRCRAGRDACNGKCFDLDTDEQRCGGCSSPCVPGKACCGGRCVDLDTDAANCGACGVACPEDEACRFGGNCSSCFPLTACDGACVDLTSDRDHCGACGIECTGVNAICGNGFCRTCDLFAGERPCVGVCCTGGRSCIDGECELF